MAARKHRRSPRAVVTEDTVSRVLRSGLPLDARQAELVERWCLRQQHLLFFRDLAMLGAGLPAGPEVAMVGAIFDQHLLTCITQLKGTTALDAFIDQHYDTGLATGIAWLKGVYRIRKATGAAVSASTTQLVVEQTLSVLPALFLAEEHVRSVLLDTRPTEKVEQGDGPVKAAVLAMSLMAKRTPHLRHRSSVSKLFSVLRDLRARSYGPMLLEMYERGGTRVGTPGLDRNRLLAR